MTSPVSGSTAHMRSTSSPKSCTRTARSSYAGKISIVSPRTRNLLRANAKSLRSYCELDEPAQDRALVALLAHVEHQELLGVHLGRAESVDRRHRRHDDHVAAGEQRARGRVAQPVDLVVDRAVLLDVRVGRRDVRLGLVVVVVGDEVLDPVLREELPELGGQLRGERLVGRHHQRGPLRLRDHVGDREALPRAGDAEQRLELVAVRRARRPRPEIASGWSPAGAMSVTSSNSGTRGSYRRGATAKFPCVRTRVWVSDVTPCGFRRLAGFELGPDLVDLLLEVREVAGVVDDPRGHLAPVLVVACSAIRRSASSRGTPRASRRSSRSSSGASTTITAPYSKPRFDSTSSGTSCTTIPSGGAAATCRRNSSPIAGWVIASSSLRVSSVTKARGGERGPVERAVGPEDLGPEPLHERGQRRRARLDHFPRDRGRRRPPPRRAPRASARPWTCPSRSRP